MENQDEKQKIIDNEHLKLLTLFHYISGGLTLALTLFIGGYFFLIFAIIASAGLEQEFDSSINSEFPEVFLTIFVTIMVIILIFVLAFGVAQIVSGRLIEQRKMRWFSFTIAIINLLSLPYGTILGVLTIIVLDKQSIKEKYFRHG